MKITDVSISVHSYALLRVAGFPKEARIGVLTIETSEGVSGHKFPVRSEGG